MKQNATHLLKTLEDQSCFAFTGKINLINSNNSQLVGILLMKDGIIVGSSLKEKNGIGTVFDILAYLEYEKTQLKIVVEPELINENQISFNLSINELNIRWQESFKIVEANKKLRPNDNLKLLLMDTFLIKGEAVNSKEFELMKIISIYNSVREIYKRSVFSEYEITSTLVSLRKKGALKVFK